MTSQVERAAGSRSNVQAMSSRILANIGFSRNLCAALSETLVNWSTISCGSSADAARCVPQKCTAARPELTANGSPPFILESGASQHRSFHFQGLAMHPMLGIAVRAARRAGAIINRAARDVDLMPVTRKRHNDFVTEVDKPA